MQISRQDLNEDGRFWSHARAWIRPAGEWWNRRVLAICWTFPCSHCGWSVSFGGGDSGRNLGFTLAVPFLCTFYVTIERFFPRRLFEWNFDRGDSREISIYFHGGAIWWRFWVGSMASWSRDFPWCRWYRQGNFTFASLLGKQRYTCETLREGIPVEIQMPEGVYPGVAKIERRTWKRPLWRARVRVSTWIDVERGIPFQGKGENSWDCGDDGLFGAGVDMESVEKAIQHFHDRVMENRRRYGQPSQRAIQEALVCA